MASKFTLMLSAGLLALSGGLASADEASTAEQMVNIMNKVWGQYPKTRANHAKGTAFEGQFTPSPAGKTLSKAALFTAASVPVLVRFSDSTGVPNLPDGDPNANPHGMAIKFHLASGDDVDLVANSLSFFPVATGEEFIALLQAIIDSPPDAKHPNKVEQFFGAHPAAVAAFGAVKTPSSFAREVYNGVDTFVFVGADGARTPFRFKITPDAGTEYRTKEEAAKMAPNALMDEIKQRIAAGPVKFALQAQLAGPGDAIDDATKPYPADRKLVDLGSITLTKAAVEDPSLNFLPLNLVAGIEPSNDPLITFRNDAYAVSYGRRLQ